MIVLERAAGRLLDPNVVTVFDVGEDLAENLSYIAMLIWGIILALVGLALLNGASWARWTSIVLVGVNVFGQLGFLGNTNDTVWLLITLTLNIIVLYALIVRWHESQRELEAR